MHQKNNLVHFGSINAILSLKPKNDAQTPTPRPGRQQTSPNRTNIKSFGLLLPALASSRRLFRCAFPQNVRLAFTYERA